MKNKFIKLVFTVFLFGSIGANAQEDYNTSKSNIQTYTPSVLLKKGQWDVKLFNNLYTETIDLFGINGTKRTIPRQTFFTSTIDIFTGLSDENNFNIGLLLEYRSNTTAGKSAVSVFSFNNDINSRNGLSSFALALKWQPIKSIGTFSIQSAFHIPLIDEETNSNGVYLDQTAYMFQNRFFYDYTFPNGKWQLFTEVSTEYNFGDDSSFANNTFVLSPGLFLSFFPSDSATILGFLQHSNRYGDFSQDYTSLGFGGKYQLTEVMNLEVLYSKFIRGNDTGLGQSFNIGLRALF